MKRFWGVVMDIRKLEYINIRDIWNNEPRDFTTWLANNIDYLTDKLGFRLNVLGVEHQIGSFNVDIFCEDEQGNSVIIENQLEKTDHNHLGQILTYAIGSSAKTVIWISPEPRDEHVAVIEWLNEITPVDMSWYLIKIEAVRIGDSPVSPLFTVIVGSTQEGKTRGSEKRELAERHKKRIDFWDGLLNKLNLQTRLFGNISASKDSLLSTGAGVSGVNYQVIIRMKNASILLAIERRVAEENKKIFDYLFENKTAIEQVFGDAMTWRRMDGQISSRIQYDIEGCGLKDEDTWETAYEIISEKLILLDKAFKPFIKKIPQII